MNKEKQIKRLFAGMVADILGFEKTRQLMKEATDAISLAYGQGSEVDIKTYDVYFEVFGKKMKTQILAESEEQAKEIIKSKVIFHRIV